MSSNIYHKLLFIKLLEIILSLGFVVMDIDIHIHRITDLLRSTFFITEQKLMLIIQTPSKHETENSFLFSFRSDQIYCQ